MNKRLVKISLLWLLLSSLLLTAIPAMAQEDRALVTGTVTDPSRSAVAGAGIEIDSKATGFHREVKTTDAGTFLVPGLPIGVYQVTIRKEGFAAERYAAIELAVGRPALSMRS